MIYIPVRKNVSEAKFILCGKLFPPPGGVWGQSGKHSLTAEYLPIDNENIFEAYWAVKLYARDIASLDEVARQLLDKLLPFRPEILGYVHLHQLRVIFEAYVAHERDSPFIGLGADTLATLASFGSSLGLDVVKLPDSERTLALDCSGYEGDSKRKQ